MSDLKQFLDEMEDTVPTATLERRGYSLGKTLKRGRVRCEVLNAMGGTQCRFPASRRRDGHNVCKRHAKLDYPQRYVE